ncbi:hypothetical protein KUTeg_017363 [Tegillarca granosa]|uniref:Uncharacterized protein n=1 Tax=Tegillarca granosa TaxID=220873 RepID=A0ABQ9ENX2_TEGGR|nr:hypothetical protein KUTeg_017363 [Tegillarca granosa]
MKSRKKSKVIFSLTTNAVPIMGQNITFSCLIFDQQTWLMSWSKNSDLSLTSCTSTFCTAVETSDKRYLFSTNESADDNFTMMWKFKDNSLQAEYITSIPSDCDHHKNTTFKNYTGFIKKKQEGQFKGEGQLTCECGIDGHSTTVVKSLSLEAYFYDCNIAICVAVTIPITILLIAIINGIIYLRNKKAGCFAFIKQRLSMIIIKGIFDLLILALVITICHIACITETLKVTILIILLPVLYTICCLIVWFLCAKQHKNRRKHYFCGVCCVKKDKREMDSDVDTFKKGNIRTNDDILKNYFRRKKDTLKMFRDTLKARKFNLIKNYVFILLFYVFKTSFNKFMKLSFHIFKIKHAYVNYNFTTKVYNENKILFEAEKEMSIHNFIIRFLNRSLINAYIDYLIIKILKIIDFSLVLYNRKDMLKR